VVRPTAVTNRIRALRTDRGLTQAQLAELLGVTRQTVIAVEQGKYSPSLELAFQIARALGRSIDEVFAYEPGGGRS
jgi:putative transcriptional regulator